MFEVISIYNERNGGKLLVLLVLQVDHILMKQGVSCPVQRCPAVGLKFMSRQAVTDAKVTFTCPSTCKEGTIPSCIRA